MILIFYSNMEITEEQVRRGFIEKVPDAEIKSNSVHYIPHHAVKKDSTKTPIRVRLYPEIAQVLMTT